jgi:hypothetical protein
MHNGFRAAGRCGESKPAQRDTARDEPVAAGQADFSLLIHSGPTLALLTGMSERMVSADLG